MGAKECQTLTHSTSYAAQEDMFCSTPLQGTKPELLCNIRNHNRVEQSRTEYTRPMHLKP